MQCYLTLHTKHVIRYLQLESCLHYSLPSDKNTISISIMKSDITPTHTEQCEKVWCSLTAMALTSEVFPAFWRPTRESSISCLKNKLTGEHNKRQKKEMYTSRVLYFIIICIINTQINEDQHPLTCTDFFYQIKGPH